MNALLNEIFPDGLAVGSGIVCTSSPVETTWIWGFYDGPTEGICRIKKSNRLLHFKKVWWDELQDNRLFHGVVFREEELRNSNPECHETLRSGLENALKPKESVGVVDQDTSLTELATAISALPTNALMYLFCTQITDELFILPVIND
jgi:hypothetical protein